MKRRCKQWPIVWYPTPDSPSSGPSAVNNHDPDDPHACFYQSDFEEEGDCICKEFSN